MGCMDPCLDSERPYLDKELKAEVPEEDIALVGARAEPALPVRPEGNRRDEAQLGGHLTSQDTVMHGSVCSTKCLAVL
jgi:hypothetical protein